MLDPEANTLPCALLLCTWADQNDVNSISQLAKYRETESIATAATQRLIELAPQKAIECILAHTNDASWIAGASVAIKSVPQSKKLVATILDRAIPTDALSYLLDATVERCDANDSRWIREYSKKVDPSEAPRMVRSLRELSSKWNL